MRILISSSLGFWPIDFSKFGRSRISIKPEFWSKSPKASFSSSIWVSDNLSVIFLSNKFSFFAKKMLSWSWFKWNEMNWSVYFVHWKEQRESHRINGHYSKPLVSWILMKWTIKPFLFGNTFKVNCLLVNTLI